MVTARATQYTGEDSRVCVFLLSFPSPFRGGGGGEECKTATRCGSAREISPER